MSTYSINHLLSSPVSTPQNYSNVNNYYQRNAEASFAGIFCLVVPIIFTFFCIADSVFFDAFDIYLNIMITGGLIFRVIAFNWVGNIAEEQNRSSKGWQILSIIFPSISLITLGYTQRLAPAKTVVSEQTTTHTEHEIVEQVEIEKELLRKAS
jgi:small neutral amino acid transporter SnatA (MarC family)